MRRSEPRPDESEKYKKLEQLIIEKIPWSKRKEGKKGREAVFSLNAYKNFRCTYTASVHTHTHTVQLRESKERHVCLNFLSYLILGLGEYSRACRETNTLGLSFSKLRAGSYHSLSRLFFSLHADRRLITSSVHTRCSRPLVHRYLPALQQLSSFHLLFS